MRVSLLGPLDVEADTGQPVEITGARLRSLLVRLAAAAPEPVSSSALIDCLWQSDPPTDAANALQSLVSRLRRALGDPALVPQTPAGYRLAVSRDDVDVERFRRLSGESRAIAARDPARAAELARAALALWRAPGPQTWGDGADALAYQSALRDERLALTAETVEWQLAAGSVAEALASAGALAGEAPLAERFVGLLMRALAADGRRIEALAEYDRLRLRLADELGLDPSDDVQALQLAILRGDLGSAPAYAPQHTDRRPIGNLPAALTSFVGRGDDVRKVQKALVGSRLVTLFGPGGAGKTRLAIEALRDIDGAADGAWIAELAAVSDGADVAAAVLDALEIRDATLIDATRAMRTSDAVGALEAALRDRQCVIVLDNCEHVIDAVARLAQTLLTRCTALRIVATSREPLAIDGELLIAVQPLDHPGDDDTETSVPSALQYPAIRLFVERASAATADFTLDDGNAATVAEIVRRLDGLPLAIELAAARLRSISLADVEARLSDRFRLLTGGSRTALPRHRTLRAVVEWSWDLLSDAEQAVAARASVFAGGVSPLDARTVCAGTETAAEDVDDVLAALAEKSWLQPLRDDGSVRYRMLETVREFGLEQLAARGLAAQARHAHAMRFAAVVAEAAPRLRTAEQLEWIRRLAAERDNVVAALRFLADTGDGPRAVRLANDLAAYWMFTGRHAEAANLLSIALRATGDTVSELDRLTAQALRTVNVLSPGEHHSLADISDSMDQLETLSRQLASLQLPDDSLLVLLRPALAWFTGQEDAVEQWFAQGPHGTDPWMQAAALLLRSAFAENSGRLDAMRADATAALAAFREIGERWGTASALGILGQLDLIEGNLGGALAHLREALALAQMMGGHDDAVMLRLRLADVLSRLGDMDAARAELATLRAGERAVGRSMQLLVDAFDADFLCAQGRLDDARRIIDSTLPRLAELADRGPLHGHVAGLANALGARVATASGDEALARRRLAAAYTHAVGTRDMPIVAHVAVAAATLAAATGEFEEAARLLGYGERLRGAADRTSLAIAPTLAATAAALGDAAADRAYRAGLALSTHEVIDALARATGAITPGGGSPEAPAGRTPRATAPSTARSSRAATRPVH